LRLSLKAINAELAKRGFTAKLAKGEGYFYVWSGEATDWWDRTLRVPTLRNLTLEQWVDKIQKLRERNRELIGSAEKRAAKQAKKETQSTPNPVDPS
jgi:hypothetical protein